MADDLALKLALRSILTRAARERRTVTYLELSTAADFPGPHRIHRLTLLLEDLLREDAAAGRPLLTALAVGRGSAGLPQGGYFQLLSALGLHKGPERGPEAAKAHAAELEKAWLYWGEN